MPAAPDAVAPTALPWWRALGPGFVVAATGVGAGDLIAAAVAGRQYGLAVLWVAALGALFKWALNEGVSRWQLATGTTLIEGWAAHMPRWVNGYFLVYLVLWGFLVAGALSAACGVAGKALLPMAGLSVGVWAVLHALAGYLIVRYGRYAGFERLMQGLMAMMFVAVIGCALWVHPDWPSLAAGLFVPTAPKGSLRLLLGVMGGVGGSVTLLCYGYWIQEKRWNGAGWHRRTLWDLTTAYGLTGFFGVAVIMIAARVHPADASGTALVLALAEQLGQLLGPFGAWCFLLGFWGAVFTSLLGVWQGVPYLFADYVAILRQRKRGRGGDESARELAQTPAYRWFLLYLAFPPLLLLLWRKPVAIVILYAVAGAFFMPFLASVLLVMNNRKRWVGALRNGWFINLLLGLSLVLFAGLFVVEVMRRLGS